MPLTKSDIMKAGYSACRKLPDGRWLAIHEMMFTTGLMVDLDEVGYRYRYCYEEFIPALIALETWEGKGDPPGPWLVQKGLGVDRLNPVQFKKMGTNK